MGLRLPQNSAQTAAARDRAPGHPPPRRRPRRARVLRLGPAAGSACDSDHPENVPVLLAWCGWAPGSVMARTLPAARCAFPRG